MSVIKYESLYNFSNRKSYCFNVKDFRNEYLKLLFLCRIQQNIDVTFWSWKHSVTMLIWWNFRCFGEVLVLNENISPKFHNVTFVGFDVDTQLSNLNRKC